MKDKWFAILLAVVIGSVLVEQELKNQREHELKLLACEGRKEK